MPMNESSKEVVAEWAGDLAFMGRNPSGASVQMGTLNGDPGISPMELLLIGVAGCTGIDVVSTLKKQRQPLQDLKIKVLGKRADTYPRVYTEIEIIYFFWGEDLDQTAVERAIRLSEEKYCSASAMMQATAVVHTSYQILTPTT